MTSRMSLVADSNLLNLSLNPYPGRILLQGMDATGRSAVQFYAITGRSEGSRNRRFDQEANHRVFTEVADPAKPSGDPALTIYNAMRATGTGSCCVVSNGSQTDTIVDAINAGNTFNGALQGLKYEPDAPNFTPRIAGMLRFDLAGKEDPFFKMAMIRRSAGEGGSCDRFSWVYDKIPNGFAYAISTYMGDGNPLPAFKGEPLLMPLKGDIEAVAHTFWEALDEQNRVCLVVKFISLEGSRIKIINRFNKV